MAKRTGFYWKNKDLNDLSTTIRFNVKGRLNDLDHILEDIGMAAEDRMKELIATTPSGINPGKDNRILTGTMHDAVGFKPVKKGGPVHSVEFGWTREQIKYFIYQEQGTGSGTGGYRNIVPMHALLQVFLEAREELRQQLVKEFR